MGKEIKKPLTVNERKKIERQRKRDAGLKKVEVWVLPEDEKKLKDIEKKSQIKAYKT